MGWKAGVGCGHETAVPERQNPTLWQPRHGRLCLQFMGIRCIVALVRLGDFDDRTGGDCT